MAITGSRSTFPEIIDVFTEYTDLLPSELTNAQRWQELKLKVNKTTSEIEEFNTLTTQLAGKIFTPEALNKISDVAYNLELFFRDNVEGYLQTKQQEFDATLAKFSDKGLWSNTTTYSQWNTVEYDNELYISKQNNNLNHIPIGDLTDTWWRKIAKRGIQGQAGLGLSFVGNYDNSFMYTVGNAVRYNNNIYYCINDSLGNLPTNTSYWQLFLSNSGIAVQSTEPTSIYLGLVWINTSTPNNEIKFWDGVQWVSIGTVASKVSIIDSGDIITATNVEDALQEIVNNVQNNSNEINILSNEVDNNTININNLQNEVTVHLADKANPHNVTAAQVGAEPAFAKNSAFNKNFGIVAGTVAQGNDSRLSDSRKCNNTFDNAVTARTNLEVRKITSGTANPTGGVNGDIYFQR